MRRSTGRRRSVSSRWTVPLLLDTLRRQGWGPLDGTPWKGLRAVLAALCSRVDYHSGQGVATIEQIATAAGYGMRWTRVALTDLEEIGLITWLRGGVRYGRPVPSQFRVSKTMLVDLIHAAREQRTAQMVAWAAATRQRLTSIRTIRMVRGRRKTAPKPVPGVIERKANPAPSGVSAHVAVAASPSRWRGDPKGSRPSPDHSATTSAPPGGGLPDDLTGPALARAALIACGRARQ